ncbi:MAG: hypothetical protein IJZ84_01545 [Lachnospiraceae bacterium]|nr:hypothetical protein [Lachnospiraceae bacterium]
MKSKLGISVGMLGAIMYFMGLFSGYTVLLLMVGYVLLFEDNAWLRRTAVKALVVCVSFSLLYYVIGLIPDLIGVIDDVFNIFGESFSITVISRIIYFIQSVISFAETVLLLILGYKALSQKTLVIKPIDKIITEHMKEE